MVLFFAAVFKYMCPGKGALDDAVAFQLFDGQLVFAVVCFSYRKEGLIILCNMASIICNGWIGIDGLERYAGWFDCVTLNCFSSAMNHDDKQLFDHSMLFS